MGRAFLEKMIVTQCATWEIYWCPEGHSDYSRVRASADKSRLVQTCPNLSERYWANVWSSESRQFAIEAFL